MLLDKYIPEYQFNKIHKTIVNGSAKQAYNSTMDLDLSKSKLIKILFKLRGLPFNAHKFSKINSDMRFTLVEQRQYSEFLYGFWFSKKVEWVTDLNEFSKNSQKYNAKVGWSFFFNERTDGTTEIITETRVLCLNKSTKLLFSIYWFFIKPFSGFVRIEMLRLIKYKLTNE